MRDALGQYKIDLFNPAAANKPQTAPGKEEITTVQAAIRHLLLEYLKRLPANTRIPEVPIEKKVESWATLITESLTKWLKNRYSKTNLTGQDILNQAANVEFSPKEGFFKIQTNFEIANQKIWFKFNRQGIITETNAADQSEEKKEYLTKNVILKITEELVKYLEGLDLNILKKGEGSITLDTPEGKITLKITRLSTIPEKTLSITHMRDKNGTESPYITLIGPIVLNEQTCMNPLFNLEGELAKLVACHASEEFDLSPGQM